MLRALSRKGTASRPWAWGLELLLLNDGSLPQNRPAADLPASLPTLTLRADEQQQQHASFNPWQGLLGSAASARQRPASLPSLSGIRAIVTAGTAADCASVAKSSGRQDKGPDSSTDTSTDTSTGAPSSSSAAQLCPLHACLLHHGITDLAAFSAPRHLALSQEAVSSNVEPKLAALAAEGLSPKQIVQLVRVRTTSSLLSCSYQDTFQPNLQLLRQIRAYIDHRPHPKNPHLTAAGNLLANSPAAAAMYLSRDPSKVQQLLRWLEGSLGVGLQRLAGCKDLCNALALSADAASAVCLSLREHQVSAERVAHMLVRQPTLFGYRPAVMSARLGALQQHLGLDAAAALKVAIAHPNLLAIIMGSKLPPLLRFLDGYMGEVGAGRRLLRAQPVLAALSAAAAERSIGSLAARGYSQRRIQAVVSKHPIILALDLDSPLQQQKLMWMERVSPWTLDDYLASPSYITAATRRLSARLALLREFRLQLPSSPGTIAVLSNVNFMAVVRQQLARQGQELPWASWAQWEDAWLGTEEGREWGFPPLKE
ncbi:hypothetical protein N2152v2_009968 [Parachlorella kessleri]